MSSTCQVLTDTVRENPFHVFCGLEIASQAPGKAVCRFTVGPNTANAVGVLHGGILYALMDVACFLAVIPTLEDEELAVSHDVHFSVAEPAPYGTLLELRAQVDKRGKSVIFSRVEAWRVAPEPERLVATGSVTKSVVRRPRLQERRRPDP